MMSIWEFNTYSSLCHEFMVCSCKRSIESQVTQLPYHLAPGTRERVYSTTATGSKDTDIVWPSMDGMAHSQAQDYPLFNCADKLSPAFFEGLAAGPDSWESGNSSIIRPGIVDYFIFCLFQGGCDVFSEHVRKYSALKGFNLSFRLILNQIGSADPRPAPLPPSGRPPGRAAPKRAPARRTPEGVS
jgi:hypothetical protein